MHLLALLLTLSASPHASDDDDGDDASRTSRAMVREGRHTFRYDTFGDEAFWTGALKLNQAVQNVPPRTALAVGLKVDVDALPATLVNQLRAGQVNIDDPAVTLALLRLDAVVGLRGQVDSTNHLTSLGVTCALCHSTVDDSLAPGIGHRRDGWPNRDLDVGTIVSLAPDLSSVTSLLGVDEQTLKYVVTHWGPGKYDAEVFLDGRALRPDGQTGATLIPPAYGLAGVSLSTYTGWGNLTYWNAFVANLEMHGQGSFTDARLDDATRFPVAARAGFSKVRSSNDQITSKLGALQYYQLSLPAPTPPAGSFDVAAAGRGNALFEGKAKCAGCHVPPLFTEPGWPMHTAAEIGIDDFQSSRSPDQRYRTTPLKGLFSRSKGGYYHDGRYAGLPQVVQHYDSTFGLALTPAEQADLVEYLKSL